MPRSAPLYRNWTLPLLAALLAAPAGFCLPVAAQEGSATRIATCNPAKVLAEMRETRELNERERAKRQRLEDEQKQKAADVSKAREDMKVIKKGTPQYDEKTNAILQMTIELQTWTELQKAQLTRRHNLEMKMLFDKINAAIKAIAEARKLDMVLADYGDELPEEVDMMNPDQLHQLIRNRNVLYGKPGVDISSEVIANLDAGFQKKP